MTRISGAGGGGGKGGGKGGRAPKEAADSLDSRQYAKLVDLISEGEIQGLKDGLQSIFLDNTPLQNADGSFNFENVEIALRNGTQSQESVPFDSVENVKSVGVEVKADTPITRAITDTDVDAVRVLITIPQLQQITSKGDIIGAKVQLRIQVQYNGGGFTTVVDDTINGRTGDQYQRDYEIALTGAFPAEIRVVRVTPDSTSAKLSDAFTWTAYTEIVNTKLRYPNTALVAARIDAEQFSNIPSRTYLVRGIKVKIPNNATVDQATGRLTYAGIWGGTFGAAQWCSDPAWILWDLLTSRRYGFGDHLNVSQLDKWAFYQASKYCAELVPDGFGGTEPRFTCNVNIQAKEEAYKLINDLCSVFRAMPYWTTGSLTVAQDRPSDPVYLFTPANVGEEGFSYVGGSLKTRPTVAVVAYLDLELRDNNYEVVEDQAGIAKYGVVTTEVNAFACTSRGQAARLGEWLLYSEQYEGSEVVSFKSSIDAGVMVRPGQVISIADPVRAGVRQGGRIVSATTTSVTVDKATDFTTGGHLSVILPDGTIQKRTVGMWSGNVAMLTGALSQAPQANSVWVYETSSVSASLWRVVAVQEQDGSDYAITALAHNPSKYDYIERGQPLQTRSVSQLNVPPDPPTNLVATEVLYERATRALSKVLLSWRPVVGVSQYRVRWRLGSGNWTTQTIERPDYEILDSTEGIYEIQVYSLNSALVRSAQATTLTFTAYGKTAPPVDVTGMELVPVDEATAIISWNRATDLDVLLGGKVVIRHTPKLVDATWADSMTIVAAAAGSQTQKTVPLLEGTYFLKFEDDTGNRSTNAASVVVDLPAPQSRLELQQYAEDQLSPPFPGTKTNMQYNSTVDGLVLTDSAAIGEYVFNTTIDAGAVFDVNLQRRFTARSYLPNELWDDLTALIDDWPEIDGSNLDATNAMLYVRTTNTSPTGSPTWSDWHEFANAIVRGRGFQFKLVAKTEDPAQNILVDELGAIMELQQRVERSAKITTAAATYSATFPNAFYEVPSVGITAYNMATGDYFAVTNVTRTGFDVVFRNSAGTAIARDFIYTAVGYGREIA